jgi:hypothetical protein
MTQRTIYREQGILIMQGTRRTTVQRQPQQRGDVWDEDPDESVVQPFSRIARASLPVQEQQRRQQPPYQGASSHYAGSSCAIHPEDQPSLTDEYASGGLLPSRVPARATAAIDEGLDERPARTSARRYQRSMTTAQQHETVPVTRRPRRRSPHGLVFIGLALLCMLLGFVLISALSVIEIPGGDVSKMVVYTGPVIYGQGADLVAVTLSLAHDQHGQPELILHYQNNEVILYDGRDGKFHLQPQE